MISTRRYTLNIKALERLLLSLLFIAAIPTLAAEVYRWKDANGVVHFGDEQSAPKGSAKIVTKESAVTRLPEPVGASATGAAFAGLPAEKISTCGSYARSLVGGPAGNSAWKANAEKIQSICPGVGFQCHTYNHHPEKDRCDPFVLVDRKVFFRDTQHDFPIAARPAPPPR